MWTMREEKRRTRTVDETAKILGVSRGTIYRLVREGAIQHLRFYGRIVIPLAAIEDMLGAPLVPSEAVSHG